MTRFVDLSPAVPEGFKGPPSTDVAVQADVRIKPADWQSTQATLSCPTGCHRAPAWTPEDLAGIDSAPARAFAQVSDEPA